MPEPAFALPPYLGPTSFGSNQRVRRENDSLDRFLILLTFVRVTELAKELANRVRMRADTSRIVQGRGQFQHRDVAILCNDLEKESAMRIELSLAPWATLSGRAGLSNAHDRLPPTRTDGRGQLQTQRSRPPA